MKKKGISLIVLIITIIVLIILATTIIITISKNNPVKASKEAVINSDIATIKDLYNLYATNLLLKNKNTTANDINAKLNDLTDDATLIEKYGDYISVDNGELVVSEYAPDEIKDAAKDQNLKVKLGLLKAKSSWKCFYDTTIHFGPMQTDGIYNGAFEKIWLSWYENEFTGYNIKVKISKDGEVAQNYEKETIINEVGSYVATYEAVGSDKTISREYKFDIGTPKSIDSNEIFNIVDYSVVKSIVVNNNKESLKTNAGRILFR